MKMAVSARTVVNRAPALRWQVLIAVPPSGFGPQLAIMRAWLDHSCGPSDWAAAPARGPSPLEDPDSFSFVRPHDPRSDVDGARTNARHGPLPTAHNFAEP